MFGELGSFYLTSSILTIAFGAVLYKVMTGTGFKFVTVVAGLLLTSNVTHIVATLADSKIFKPDGTDWSWLGVYCIFIFI